MSYNLLGVGNNSKVKKGDGLEYQTAIMHLVPQDTKICPFQNVAKCKEGCLVSAGRGQMNVVQRGRQRKTDMYLNDYDNFISILYKDIFTFVRRAEKRGIQPCVRLNGTSDILWEKTGIVDYFYAYDVQFYDYTKVWKRAYRDIPSNYHLTLSYSEADMNYAENVYQAVLDSGINMAVVSTMPMPKKFRGLDCVDGDRDDLRFLDPKGVVVWLKAKGKAVFDTSGFVIHKPLTIN